MFIFWTLFSLALLAAISGGLILNRYQKERISGPETNTFSIHLSDLSNNKEATLTSNSSKIFFELAKNNIPFTLEAGVKNVGRDIHLHLSIPKKKTDFTKDRIKHLWPEAEIKKAEEGSIFNVYGTSVGAFLTEKEDNDVTIEAVKKGILNPLQIIRDIPNLELVGEGLGMQVIARPIKKDFQKKIKELIGGTSSKKEAPFEGNIRFMASAHTQFKANELLDSLSNSFKKQTIGKKMQFVRTRNSENIITQFTNSDFNEHQAIPLETEEVSNLVHLA